MTRKMLVCCSFLLVIGGCSKWSPPTFPKTYAVHGKVLLDGVPLKGGIVEFQPSAGADGPAPGQEATGVIQPDGTFTLRTFSNTQNDGAVPGNYAVIVRMLEGGEAGNPKLMKTMPKIPEKYGDFKTSGLTVVVKEGDNHLEPFELKAGE